jgi:hypothetical protein
MPPAPNAAKRTVDQWKRDLQGKAVDVAHEMIVADGTLEAYQAFDQLFTRSPFAAEVREWIVRQSKMIAWNEAVTLNTAASYRAFLAQYPDTDLSITARTLIERLRFKPSPLPQVAALGPCTTPSAPTAPTLLKKTETAPAIEPQPPVVLKKTEVIPVQPPVIIKKVDVIPPRESDPPVRMPHREVYVDGPVNRGPPMQPVYHPMAMGFGFHGGMMGVGRPMSGYGRRF